MEWEWGAHSWHVGDGCLPLQVARMPARAKAAKGGRRHRQAQSHHSSRNAPPQRQPRRAPPPPTVNDAISAAVATASQSARRSSPPRHATPSGDRRQREARDKGVPSPGSTFSQDAEPASATKKQMRHSQRGPGEDQEQFGPVVPPAMGLIGLHPEVLASSRARCAAGSYLAAARGMPAPVEPVVATPLPFAAPPTLPHPTLGTAAALLGTVARATPLVEIATAAAACRKALDSVVKELVLEGGLGAAQAASLEAGRQSLRIRLRREKRHAASQQQTDEAAAADNMVNTLAHPRITQWQVSGILVGHVACSM